MLKLFGLARINNRIRDSSTVDKATQTNAFELDDDVIPEVTDLREEVLGTTLANNDPDILSQVSRRSIETDRDQESGIEEDEEEEEERTEVQNKSGLPSTGFVTQFGGIALTLFASILSSSNLVIVKTLTRSGMRFTEAATFAYSGVFIPSIPLFVYCEWRRRRKKLGQRNYEVQTLGIVESHSLLDSVWPLTIPERRWNAIGLLVQSFFGVGMVLFRFLALKYITVGDTAVICISSPLIVTILAHFTLGEKTGFIPILMAILALVGVGIIARPPILTGKEEFDTNALIGTASAFGSMSCAALQTIICRKIRGIHFTFQSVVSGLIGMTIPAIFALISSGGQINFPSQWPYIVMTITLACFAFGVIGSMLFALKIEKAGVVALVRSCDVLFGFILQFIFFDVYPDIYSAIGGLLIVTGVLVMAYRKWRETLPPKPVKPPPTLAPAKTCSQVTLRV